MTGTQHMEWIIQKVEIISVLKLAKKSKHQVSREKMFPPTVTANIKGLQAALSNYMHLTQVQSQSLHFHL